MNPSLRIEPLTADAFEPFGDVIETDGRPFHYINSQMVERYDDLARVDVRENGGRPGISLLVAQPYSLPLRVRFVERHPLSSQAFVPLGNDPFLVIVAPAGDEVAVGALRAFVTNGRQGINYRRGVWHHVLLTLGRVTRYLAVDRIGEGPNCDKFVFPEDVQPVVDMEPLPAVTS
ncbi:MAG: ureidoglycolate lyase [Rubrivivax sp.]